MRIDALPGSHLTYCLNVHPGRSLAEVERGCFHHATAVRDLVCARRGASAPLGVGLWLSHDAAVEIEREDRLARFADRLLESGLYVPTMNGFPFGPFHGGRVKEEVYRPDWADPRRLEHTLRLAHILARLLPTGGDGTISTLPITYRDWADAERERSARENLRRLAWGLDALFEATGRRIRLAVEPEPDCLIDDLASAVAFWRKTRAALASDDLDRWEQYIGLCLDTAHAATLFEPLEACLATTADEAIAIHKVQLAAVPEVPLADDPSTRLAPFHDEVYLHQTCLRDADGRLLRFADLPPAFASESPPAVWRTHYHVPLSWRPPTGLETTAGQITSSFLRAAYAQGTRHFELEIYTLGLMLDDETAVHAMLADDLAWVLDRAEGA